jgi:hypothetical protein
MAALKSITIQPNARCVPSPSAAKIICLRDPMLAGKGGGDLQPAGLGEAEWHRSGSLSDFGAASYCRSPDQLDCGVAALEFFSHRPRCRGCGVNIQ